jgi:GR25 family glycosyltransferase involved in LPS biosynthesis
MILQEALRMGYERILIFEDDLTFITGFNGLMNHAVPIVPDDWEFLYLGYSYANVYEKYRKTEIPVNEYWVIPGHNWGTQCYAINGRNTIIKLLDGLKKINDQVDVQLTFKVLKQKCIKFYAIKPCAVGQLKDRSDVQTR